MPQTSGNNISSNVNSPTSESDLNPIKMNNNNNNNKRIAGKHNNNNKHLNSSNNIRSNNNNNNQSSSSNRFQQKQQQQRKDVRNENETNSTTTTATISTFVPEVREYLFKILVIGELGTGKTSFIKRYVHQYFSQYYRATVCIMLFDQLID
ncbi:hypothetical protein BLA29_010734 [Euroglyphus maynei]|uniref:Uncharacterized protein n=1 Tax=Euroglyphus maynei TaxID=6958 RepID=A0A1Y3BRP8_EURMA|nr:hypothetical protein BLA29_010734 [Euroglyphus maynei]